VIVALVGIWRFQRTHASGPKPYHRSASDIAKIEAEDFDDGGQGISYFDLHVGNYGFAYRDTDVDIYANEGPGNIVVGQTEPGEWLCYTVEIPAKPQAWDFLCQCAMPGPGVILHVEFDHKDVTGPVHVPDTGDWQNYKPIRVPLTSSPTPGRH